jgi:hydrogenase maturation protein HypF
MLFQTRILVSGIVQGVGFRPFCVRLAQSENISGFARNTSQGVELELHGEETNIDRFLSRLVRENPPASFIRSVKVLAEKDESSSPPSGFEIAQSLKEPACAMMKAGNALGIAADAPSGAGPYVRHHTALIPPDLAVCEKCLAEMKDPGNRRFRYPFINCTDCGPRYTIIRDLPYDRPKTTMRPFLMCPQCAEEYSDPSHRRFHAEPNACSVCGPQVWLTDGAAERADGCEEPSPRFAAHRGDDAVRICSSLLDEGKIIAIKGIGGFHIACTPFCDESVALLRRRKRREHKPFALMAASLEEAERLVYVPAVARELLTSPASPVVLCCRKKDTSISHLVAPGQRTLGIMLPYTPLHHLLLEGKRALIMTSANFSDAPIVSENRTAFATLSPIADFFLFSDREIRMAIDDSVAMPLGRNFFLMRRGRGYTPLPMTLPHPTPVILGAGAEMKGSFCFCREDILFPGQYLGDMKQRGTISYYNRAMDHFLSLFDLKPKIVAHDMHPQYISTQIAKKLGKTFSAETLEIQHHHAHFAACLFENGIEEESIGILFDGTGYGDPEKEESGSAKGTIWGGEFFAGNAARYERVGHFFPSRLPGGDAAVREPWRYALGLLQDIYGKEKALETGTRLWNLHPEKIRMVLDTLPFAPATTSCGRFFDAAAALLGCGSVVSFDGQAAMNLESSATGMLQAPFEIERREGKLLLDWRPAIRWIVESTGRICASDIAGGIHGGLAHAVVEICGILAEERGLRFAALSGGVWQNRRLTATTCHMLRKKGITPLIHRILPPNDECVSVGQALVAASALQHSKAVRIS